LLAQFLLQENQKILVIDSYNPSSASNIASGITNPVTGRKFVKTWLADQILPFADKTYKALELFFGRKFFHPLLIVRVFDSVKAQNDWSVRCASEEYQPYLNRDSVTYLDSKKVKNDFGGFEISGGSRLEADTFLSLFRDFLLNENLLLEKNFSYEMLHLEADSVFYGDIEARKIIFCEGAASIENPFFKFLPFQLAKGECLIARIKNFYPDRMISSEVFIMPLSATDEYYIGATHDWNFDDDKPSEKGRNELIGNLSAILRSEYEVLAQKAAIRPTVKDRRPFIGFHPEFSSVGIFNGLGTKGISLAPFFAKHFTEHLVHQKPLMKEVDIKRFLVGV